MDINTKKKISTICFILAGFFLATSGMAAFLDDRSIFGLMQLIGAAFNFGMLLPTPSNYNKNMLEDMILIMNSVVAMLIGTEYLRSNYQYIQYLWFSTSVFYIMVLVIRKR